MPVKKHANRKNAKQEDRDSAIVPTKEDAGKKPIPKANSKTIVEQRTNALSTAGKKKKPK